MRAGRPSRTALGVARGFCLAARHGGVRGLAPAPELELTERMLAAAGRHPSMLSFPAVGRAALWLGERLGPGIALHLVARKRWFADRARAGLDEGRSRLVVLGGGLDALAACVAGERPGTTCVELDHPDTQVLKRRVLAGARADAPGLLLRPVDLAQSDPRRALELPAAPVAFDDVVPTTVFAAEGLLMYLPRERVVSLLRGLSEPARSRGAGGDLLLFSFLTADGQGGPCLGPRSGPLRWVLRRAGEPMLWGAGAKALEELLAAGGWHLLETVGAAELRQRYPIPARRRMMDWERFAVAGSGVFP